MTSLDATYDDLEIEYSIKFRRPSNGDAGKRRSERHTFGRRAEKSPQQFNGIHRRRRKKIRW